MKIKLFGLLALLLAALCFTGCQTATVDVTKTAKGFHAPTNPNDLEILMTKPDRPYVELGTIAAVKFSPSDTAKMHNAIRAKAAQLGANAAILNVVGLDAKEKQFALGVAVAWK